MKCLLIYSPFAKRGKIERYIPKIKLVLESKFSLTIQKTDYPKHATEIAKSACGVFDIIVVAGGDGILSEVINGIAENQNSPMLALLPLGTVNDSAKSLNIPTNINKALQTILNLKVKEIDCFKINDDYANYVVCAGQNTQSTYKTKQKVKNKLGWFAYFISAVKELFKKQNPDFSVSINNQQLPQHFVFVMLLNSKQVAGFTVNKNGSVSDGEFEVILFKKEKGFLNTLIKYFNLVRLFLVGIKSFENSKHVILAKAKTAQIINHNNLNYNIDGEKGKPYDVLNVSIINKEIKIITN